MHIKLENIIPIPLKENLQHRSSDIWKTNQVFNAGEWVKIKAPSGTGKTTFIHFLYQLRFDFEGNIFWDDINIRQINTDNVAIVRQKQLSIIFQDLKLFGNLTARENIEINRVLQQPYCASEKIDAMAARLGITAILNQKAALCSYGEQQRIAIIRALVQPFEFLLMDEPFSHLDINNKKIAAELIAAECAERKAAFILTDLDDDNFFDYDRNLIL
jgi:putative ABC transport system ATP-binding protein